MPTTKYLAFDLEIAKILEGDFSNWRKNRPLGITCAATQIDGEAPLVWYSRDEGDVARSQMTEADLQKLIAYLEESVAQGYQILTWNGLGFDFEVLAEESGCWEKCSTLALGHIDMMFDFFCRVGYPISLEKAAKGLGLSGKIEGMTGGQAPVLWKQGKFQEVLDYVAQDARTTLEVAKAAKQSGKVCWISQRGRPQEVRLTHGWLNVGEADRLPAPDVSWMRDPLNRQDFFRWTKR